jgi:hypothetical protein
MNKTLISDFGMRISEFITRKKKPISLFFAPQSAICIPKFMIWH